jgi:hypothetical protein
LYNIFYNAYLAFIDNKDITLERELNDGTTESFAVIIERPEKDDYTISYGETLYRNFSIRILEI